MKIKNLSIVAIVLIMIVVASSGCSSKLKVGSNISSSSVISTNYKWIEFNTTEPSLTNSRTITSNIKIEKSSESYQGIPSIHMKSTKLMDDPSGYGSRKVVTDIYYDTNMKNVLGGTTTTTTGADGQTTTSSINPGVYMSDIPSGIDSENTIFSYEGSGSVSVPAGTYSDADLYMNSTKDGTTSIWVVSSIPVPVKTAFHSALFSQNTSLVGWG